MIVALPINDNFPVEKLLALGFAMLWVQFIIGITHDLLDQSYDKIAKPNKPLINGRVKTRDAKIITILLFFLLFLFGLS